MKRKTLTLTLSILACLALIGVGFASWIISADTSANAKGSFIVDTVTDNRLVATGRWITINGEEVTSDDDSAKVSFGAPESMEKTGAWLTNDGEGTTEKLTVVYELTVKTKASTPVAVTGLTDKISCAVSCEATYSDYITLPEAVVSEVGEGVYRLTLTFKWGSKFGGNNPYDYYNGQDYSDELAQTALADLNAIHALNDVVFNLKIDVKSK